MRDYAKEFENRVAFIRGLLKSSGTKGVIYGNSGGKDSAHALLRAMQSGKYEIVALLTTVNRDTHRSTMHGIPTALLQAQADSIGIPLHIVDLTPKGNMEDYGAAMSRAVE